MRVENNMRACLYCGADLDDLQKGPKALYCNKAHGKRYLYNLNIKGNREHLRDYYNQLYIKKVGGLKRQSKFTCDPEITKNKKRITTKKRHYNLVQATPSWANMQDILDVYKEASYMQLQVDHIYPINGKTVCGLHVWNNLQLLTKKENCSKWNKMPTEEYVQCLV